MKRLANDINQALLQPQQAFSPLPVDYHVSTSGHKASTILNSVLNGLVQFLPLKQVAQMTFQTECYANLPLNLFSQFVRS